MARRASTATHEAGHGLPETPRASDWVAPRPLALPPVDEEPEAEPVATETGITAGLCVVLLLLFVIAAIKLATRGGGGGWPAVLS